MEGGPGGLTACCWVPTSSMKRLPDRHEASPEELEQARRKMTLLMAEMGDGSAMDAEMDPEEDEEDEEPEEGEEEENEGAPPAAFMGGGNADGGELEDDDDDDDDDDEGMPDINLPVQGKEGVQDIESDDESELNDLEIRPEDAVFLCCHQKRTGMSSLEMYVYDDEKENIFLHHDIALPAIPLSTAWIPRPTEDGEGSYAAVGTFLPFIEVWDLNVLDSPDPVVTLGGCKKPTENYQARKISTKLLKKTSHKDAVLCLRWNRGVRKVLASGSADTTIKLWDTVTGDCLHTFAKHEAPVQTIEWCPQQPQLLLSGSFDHRLVATDCRTQATVQEWQMDHTPEALCWSPHSESTVWVTFENGDLMQIDGRQNQGPVWKVAAHEGEAAGLAANGSIAGLLATAGTDRNVKLWDVRHPEPRNLASRDLGQGKVFSLQFHPDKPTYLLAAGDVGKPLVYCVTDDVSAAFNPK